MKRTITPSKFPQGLRSLRGTRRNILRRTTLDAVSGHASYSSRTKRGVKYDSWTDSTIGRQNSTKEQ
jgi:hypothetical protein